MYKFAMTFDDGLKEEYFAEPLAIDSLVMLGRDKVRKLVLSPTPESRFANAANAIQGEWRTEDERKRYTFIGDHVGLVTFSDDGAAKIHDTRPIRASSPGLNSISIEVDRDGKKELLTAKLEDGGNTLLLTGPDGTDRLHPVE